MATSKARAREEESYFISMTDMMVGLLFIFIIMLMYFALQYKDSDQQLRTADVTRTEILQKLEKSLKDQGVEVQIDTETGVLRLPDDVLFNRGETEPKAEGKAALQELARALEDIIPCYAFDPSDDRPKRCPAATHKIELLYIEGHTDSTGIYRPPIRDNWDLSTERAKRTRELLSEPARARDPEVKPILERLLSAAPDDPTSAPILSHVGQADSRPISRTATPDQNRRIDLRIIMAKPKPPPIGEIETSIGSGG